MTTTKNETTTARWAGLLPAKFVRVMRHRKRTLGIAGQFTMAAALTFALEHRAEWDPFFDKNV